MKSVARYLAGGAVAIAASIALTIVSSLLVCAGLHPEAVYTTEIAAPILGVLCGGAWIGRRATRPWLAGSIVGLLNVAVWFTAYLYLMGRWNTHRWMSDALPSLGLTHLYWWLIAVAAGAVGGAAGRRMHRPALLWILVPLLLAGVVSLSSLEPYHEYSVTTDGIHLETGLPDSEGTIVRLLTIDLTHDYSSDRQLHLGIHDADTGDSSPLDDLNTTYLGTPLDRTTGRLQPRVLCAFNAGFFGWTPKFVGFHVAPIVVDGRRLYNAPVNPDWWTFGIDKWRQCHLTQGVTWKDLPGDYETAITHVRPLIVDGKALVLRPGAGVTRLRCSRCSVAWKQSPRQLYVLIVRDPDGEMASVRQWKSGRTQTGGMDLVEVQQFWLEKGVENAIALDGGDSTQLAYLDDGRYPVVRSGYHLSRTFGYLNRRPIRLFVPMLPAYQSHNGVMNYLYVYSK